VTGIAPLDLPDKKHDEVVRLPFHEMIKCLNSSALEEQWLISGADLQVEASAELDNYLHQSFPADRFIRSEGLNVTLHRSIHANEGESARSFLRQSDYKESTCELDLELAGEAIFALNSTNYTLFTRTPEAISPYIPTRRSVIYSRIVKSLADEHGSRLTASVSPTTTRIEQQSIERHHRRLQTCTSTVTSLYLFSPNQFMCSANGPFFFGFGADGDLGIWKGFRKVWSADSRGKGNKMTLQPDGNLVLRDKTDAALWDSRTNGAADSGGEVQVADNGEVSVINSRAGKTLTIVPELDILAGCTTKLEGIARLMPGERICSEDERFSFGLTSGGALGIFFGPMQVWSADGTCCNGDGSYAHLQTDGNFVVYGNGHVLWESGTKGPPGSGGKVTISTDGTVTIFNPTSGTAVTIEPFDAIEPEEEPVTPITDEPEPPVEEEPDVPIADSCIQQVSGKIELQAGEFICSPNGRYRFGISLSGDLTLLDDSNVIWSAGTCCSEDGVSAALQESDGNFVVYNSNSEILWDSVTDGPANAKSSLSLHDSGTVAITNPAGQRIWAVAPHPVCLDQVLGDFVLLEGQFICSSTERFRFGVVDGDLSLWDDDSLVWSSGLSYRSAGVYAHMQIDGNLVVRNKDGDALWTSKTSENRGSSLRLDDGGLAKIISSNGGLLWSAAGTFSEPPSPIPLPPTPSPTPLPPTPSPTPTPPQPTTPPLDPSSFPCLDAMEGIVLMVEGDFFCSPNGKFKFGLAPDGDLALFEGSSKIWSANTCCTGENVTARLQVDGNLIVTTSVSNQIIWTSRSANNGTGIASLRVGDDGIVTITDTKLGQLWSSSPTSPPTLKPPQPTPSPVMPPIPSPTSHPPIFKAPPLDPSLLPCIDPIQGPVVLNEGDFFCSPNGKFKFGLAPDGDLSLFEASRKIWNANTCCTGEEVSARLQVDGNLVVSTLVSKQILWTSESTTKGLDVASLIVGDDGIVTITDTLRGHIWSSAISNKGDRVTTDSLVGKVMAGYQGWFFAKGDGGMNQWIHWSRPQEVPSKKSITIDAWPDLRELDDDELYPTQFTYKDGSNAGLYSAYNAKTVERHTRWMKDYGMHGVFVQRFIGNARAPNWTPVIDKVLGHVRSGAEKYGRTFVNMYDIGNGNEATIVEDIINDWKHLVDDEHITKSKQYLYHRGRPLVALWGFGFYDRLGSPQQVAEIIDWFQNKAEDKYKATLMGGVPTGWRDLSRDSKGASAWASIYRSYEVISPWAVGRLVDIRTANYHRTRYTEPDLAECTSLGIDYLPVVFPGFSFNNLKPKKPFNEIPRNGGTFMWHQMHNAAAAGNKMIYVAMFDEVDEATAIFKIADNQQQTPNEGRFLSADQDGYTNCPGDWYLNITGTVAGLLQDGKEVPVKMPAYP